MVCKYHHQSTDHGFSLVELLAVISIVILLAGIATFKLQPPRPIHAAKMCSGTIEAVRNEAITKGTRARVAICTDPLSEELYLTHLLALIDRDGDLNTDDWKVTSAKSFPIGTVFSTKYSGNLSGNDSAMFLDSKQNLNFQTGNDGFQYQFIEFNGLGQCEGSIQWVFSRGEIENSTVTIINEIDRDGFIIRKTGKVAYFKQPDQIVSPQN